MLWSWGSELGGIAASETQADRALPLGNRDAMGALFSHHEPRLRAVALRYTRNPDNAADVLQSALEKILRNGHQFRGGAKVSTWMYRVVANEALMWLRSERRREARFRLSADGDLDDAPDPTPNVEDWVEQREEVARLSSAIASLSREERDVIEGCALREQSYAEWGKTRGLRPGAVKSRAFRARQRLRELLT